MKGEHVIFRPDFPKENVIIVAGKVRGKFPQLLTPCCLYPFTACLLFVLFTIAASIVKKLLLHNKPAANPAAIIFRLFIVPLLLTNTLSLGVDYQSRIFIAGHYITVS